MRTTIRLDPEVLAEAQRLRREHHVGLGEAVNMLAKAGLASSTTSPRTPFVQRTVDLGLKIDATSTGAVLELLDHFDAEEQAAEQPGDAT